METNNQRKNGISCLIEQDSQTGVFIGHCLDFNLMECGPNPEDAWYNLKVVIKNHIEFCYAKYREGLLDQADKAAWDKFYCSLKRNPQDSRVEQIEIEVAEPLPEQEVPVWMQIAGLPHVDGACDNARTKSAYVV
jgi:hypothetical protein